VSDRPIVVVVVAVVVPLDVDLDDRGTTAGGLYIERETVLVV
jgi:hypothetical protein